MEEDDNRIHLDTIDPDTNHYIDNIIDFDTYTETSLCGKLETNGAFNVLHHNVRSLLSEGKKEEIDIMLNNINNPFHALTFTETWLNKDNCNMIEFRDYEHLSNIRPNNQIGGGISIFIKKNSDIRLEMI